MRTLIMAPAALAILAVSAVTGFSAASGGNTPGSLGMDKRAAASGGLGAISRGGFLDSGVYRLAKGDMGGSGGGPGKGKGGMKGDMMGGMGKGQDKKG